MGSRTVSSTRAGRLKSWMMKLRYRDISSASEQPKKILKVPAKFSNPVENYYRHKAETNLPVLYRFALQTRSLAIRDVFAKASSTHGLDLSDLLATIENLSVPTSELREDQRHTLQAVFDSSILLVLADLLSNTAREDLDIHSAAQIYDFVFGVYSEEPFLDQHKLQYVEALNELERYEQSDRLAQTFQINEIATLQEELLTLQRIRRTASSTNEWLDALNALYFDLGMSQVKLNDDDSLPLLDRLTASEVKSLEGPKVSVIMPTFSPGPGIRTAIRGLLEQSWENLEIIVVNDASPDKYASTYEEIARLDPRIRVLHQTENAGAYVARNTGLEVATGEYITTHDDDDWSHPDKIALQVQAMLDDPAVVATTSAHLRTTPDLLFRRVNMQAKFLQMNYSSLMFRRSIIDEIGHWDTVNRGGDSEFYTRLIEYAGQDRVVGILDKPLSFSRVWDGSLTSGEMSRGYFAYSRLLYRWAFRQWQWDTAKTGQKAIQKSDATRPYAIPTTFEAGHRHKDLGHFDVIYVTDFFRQAKYVDYVLNELETLSARGLRVGYIHLYSPETTQPAGFPKKLFEMQVGKKITQVSHNDSAETDLLLVYDSAVGMFADQTRSTVKSRRSVVIDHRLPSLSAGEPRTPTVMRQALRNLDQVFRSTFKVVSSTSTDQNRLRETVPANRVLPNSLIWNTHLNRVPGEIIVPRGMPVVGFHSYGNQYRWPNNAEQFKRIYTSSSFSTKLYGNLEVPITKFGERVFSDVTLIQEDQQNEEDFLKGVDFWVYFPNSRLQDELWEPVLSAMLAGKVVILPKRLREIYGDAALYASEHEVAVLVRRYSQDHQKYKALASLGQAFVESNYTAKNLLQRIQTLRRM